MISKVFKATAKVPNWILVLIGLCIFIFNDTIGNSVYLSLPAFLFLLFMLFLLLRWCFRQIRFIINLKHEKTKTELQHLKNQVHPHFFFNTLNNLYGTLEKDSVARPMVLQLSEMMRYSIYEGQKERVALEDEIRYIHNYITLQKGRYLRTVEIEFQKDVKDTHVQIMPLLFITLVENAFKHGVENLEENAYIHMSLIVCSERLSFKVINNYEPTEYNPSSGIGLENLKRRLALEYPKKHTLEFDIQPNCYTVQLDLKLV